MAQVSYRANISASTFPLISSLQGRSVIVPQQDQVYQPYVNPRENVSEAIGIPQIYFCENMMPSTHGMQSIAYKLLLSAPAGGLKSFSEIVEIVSTDGVRIFLAQASDGTVYVTDPANTAWRAISNSVGVAQAITVATVNGVSYLWLRGIGPFQYDFAANTLNAVTFTGLDYGQILGIIASNGYIIAYSSTANAWSSTLDVTDFVPSLTTGAGGGDVQEAEGPIVGAVPTGLGYIVYTTKNAVSVTYSGNSRYPFNFRAISGAGGIQSLAEVARGSASGEQFAYTSSGLQRISHVKAETLLPYITDFISGGVFESYDIATDTFSLIHANAPFRKRIAYISDRYLIISYGIVNYTNAIVVDMVQTRMGKLKFSHSTVFEINELSVTERNIPRQSIGFMQASGEVHYLSFDLMDTSSFGVLMLGKYSLLRARKTTIQEIDLENIQVGTDFSLKILTTLDGKNFWYQTIPYMDVNEGMFRRYYADVTGENHSIILKGSFNLVSAELVFTQHGRM